MVESLRRKSTANFNPFNDGPKFNRAFSFQHTYKHSSDSREILERVLVSSLPMLVLLARSFHSFFQSKKTLIFFSLSVLIATRILIKFDAFFRTRFSVCVCLINEIFIKMTSNRTNPRRCHESLSKTISYLK